jgi:predicted MFS family arabinose efflux permease
VGLSAVSGPVLGAVLTDAVSWRAAFLANVPISAAVLASARWLREDRATHQVRLDAQGTLLAMLGVGLVVYPLITGGRWPVLAAGVVVLAVFARHQRTRRFPLVERSLFHDRGFPAALVTSLLFFAVMNGLMLVVLLHLQLDQGRSVLSSGVTLLPWSGGLAVSSWFAGRYLGPRSAFGGLALLLAGILAGIACYRFAPASPWLLGALAIGGLGLGLFTVPFFTTALSHVRPHETGSAAGLLNAVQQLGATLGIAVLGSVFLHGHSAEHAFWLAAALVAATAVTTALMRPADVPLR